MNWSHCSRAGLALVVLLAALAAPAVATTVSPSSPTDTADVGGQVDVTYELTNLYANTSSDWTLRVTTELRDPTWTVATYDNQGNKIGNNRTLTTSNFTQPIEGATTRVVVRLQGTVLRPSNFSYAPAQSLTLADFDRVQGNAVTDVALETTRPETSDSRAARLAIENASAAIDDARDAGASVSGAASTLENAIDAYEGENFDNAVSLAEDAEDRAASARESSEQRDTLLLVAAGLVGLLLVGGLVYWYLNRGDDYDELG
jgi:hypothetical protein